MRRRHYAARRRSPETASETAAFQHQGTHANVPGQRTQRVFSFQRPRNTPACACVCSSRTCAGVSGVSVCVRAGDTHARHARHAVLVPGRSRAASLAATLARGGRIKKRAARDADLFPWDVTAVTRHPVGTAKQRSPHRQLAFDGACKRKCAGRSRPVSCCGEGAAVQTPPAGPGQTQNQKCELCNASPVVLHFWIEVVDRHAVRGHGS